MNSEASAKLLASLDINPDEIEDEKHAENTRALLFVIDGKDREINALKTEVQKLRDELSLLKGEQPKPEIRPSKKNEDISSEKERKTRNPVVSIFLSDDAPQFKQLTYNHALCWVHDGRNYKKLRPIVPYHKEKLEAFLKKYWAFYHKLRKFKESPNSDLVKQLSSDFDELFSTKTGYDPLDKRTSKTKG